MEEGSTSMVDLKLMHQNFIRWQDKIRFLLTTLKVSYILDPELEVLSTPKRMAPLNLS